MRSPAAQHRPRPHRTRTGPTRRRCASGAAATRRSTTSRSTSCASTIASSRDSRRRRSPASTDPLGDILRTPAASRTAAQQTALREHYLLRVDPRLRVDARRGSPRSAARRTTLLTSLVEVMAMHERAVPRPTFVLARGAYDAPTERVDAGHARGARRRCPRALPANRLGLAALADGARASADGAGRRQPLLGAALRPRPRRDAGRLRQPGAPADASRCCSTGWRRPSSSRAGT